MATKSKPADEPDLFSAAKHQSLSPLREPAPEILKNSEATLSPRLLPKNLASSLQQLSDDDFRWLLAAVLNEQKRRGKNSIAPPEKGRRRACVERWSAECGSCCVQSWCQTNSNREAVRLVKVPIACSF